MSPSYLQTKHDMGILRSDASTKVGLMLAELDGRPAYRTSTERYLKNQYYSGAPDYGALDPQSEIAIILDDWRAGMGLETYDTADTKRYYQSFGCDLRHRGRALLGWTAGTATLPTHTNAAYNQAVSNLDASSVWSNETNAYDGNTGTAATESIALNSWGSFLELYIPTISCSKIRFWWDIENYGTNVLIDVDVYYNGAWNGITSAKETNGAWVEKSLGATYNVTAARVRMYNDAGATSIASLFELQFYAESATVQATVLRGDDFNSAVYAPFGNALIKKNAGGTAFTVVSAFPVTITDIQPFQVSNVSYLLIALGTSDPYWYMTTAEAFAESTATDKTYQYFAWIHGAADTLYGNSNGNTVLKTVDPLNGGTAWGTSTTIDSPDHAITDMQEWQNLLYIMKEDRPYYIDGSGNVQDDVAEALETETSSTSGKNATIWQNKLYTQAGTQTLVEVKTDGAVTFRSPANHTTNDGSFAGTIQALTKDTFYLYAITDNSTKVEVQAMRLETIGSTTSWVIHPIQEITLTGCGAAWSTSTDQKRLYITSDTIGESLYYIPLPATYGNIEADANRSFLTDGYFVTPWLHGGFKGEDKRWIKVTATLGHAYDVDIYWELHYQKKGDSAWTDAGDFKGSSTTRVATLYLPDDGSSNEPISPMMRFKLVGKTDATTTTPELLSLDIRAILRPPIRKFVEFAVRVQDGILDKKGNKLEGTNAAYIRTVLDEARDTSSVFTFYDKFGVTKTGIMLPVDTESQMMRDLKDENPEQIYFVRIQLVDLS